MQKEQENLNHWKKNFFIIWTGQAFSQFTSSVLQFSIIWYLTDHTGSALVLSAAMLMGFLPQGILGPFIGVFIDRCHRKTIMILSDLCISMASLVLVIAGWMDSLSTGLILLVLLARSIGTAFHHPCIQAVTPQIVPEDQLTRCAGYSQTLQSASEIFSPALAAILYQSWNLGSIIFLDVIGALLAVVSLGISHIPPHERPVQIQKPPFISEIKEGFLVLKGNRGIFGLVLVSTLFTLSLMPTSALFPLMSMSYFGGTSTHASIAEIAFSIGLLIGSLILSAWGGTQNRIYPIIGSHIVMSLSLIGSGLLSPGGFWIFALFSCILGMSNPFYWGMYTPILQSSFESHYLGRVMSLSGSIRLICAPIGLALSGVFAELFGVQNWFIIAGCILLLDAALCTFIPAIRNCDQPGKQTPL
ncbi:MAG: MFS transporter [Clostridiales bacterium]|nr:MFS transporter [Clostridiales bacterium]